MEAAGKDASQPAENCDTDSADYKKRVAVVAG